MLDFILNGQASGNVAEKLIAHNMDWNVLRPFVAEDGRSYINYVDKSGKLAVMRTNAPATLTRDAWKYIDDTLQMAARPRLKAVADLRSRGLQLVIPNGMRKTVLEYQMASDITPATISMDGLRKSEADRPEVDIGNLPLPIIHKDFHFSLREVMASRESPMVLDLTTAEQAARVVAEEAEKLLVGTAASYTYGGGTVYGYTNFPGRHTQSLTAPTTSNHATTVAEILAMRQKSIDDGYYGPWLCYLSTDWAVFLDEDYVATKGDNTLRQRIAALPDILGVQTLDYLPAKTILLVQATSNVVREVVGMEIVTLQWESQGGMQLNYKVMAIMVPQLRADINGNTGIVHGSYT